MSARSLAWSPYTCKTPSCAKDRLRLVCISLVSVSLWMYRKFRRKWGSALAFQRPRFCVGLS